jgi:hypothetical protein
MMKVFSLRECVIKRRNILTTTKKLPERRMTTKPWKIKDGCNPKLPNFLAQSTPLV